MNCNELLSTLATESRTVDWYKKAGASALANFRFWTQETRRVEKANPASYFGLHADHRAKLKDIWGPQAFIFRSEYAWHGWVIPLAGEEKLIVLSATGGGTTFEVAGAHDNVYPPQCSERSQVRIIEIMHALNKVLGAPVGQKYARPGADPEP